MMHGLLIDMRWICGLCLLIVLGGCASVEPWRQVEVPELEEDEQRLWTAVKKEQAALERSGKLLRDARIRSYVNGVLTAIVPEHLRGSELQPQVKIVKHPLLNAFAYPNGAIYVHTGMLAQIQNEAQLATLLGHELTHATHRHGLQHMRTVQRSSAALGTFQALTMPFGVLGLAATALGAVGMQAAVSGYSQDKEAEADREGFHLLVAAGYEPTEAPKLFEYLKADLEARDEEEPFFFGSHPKLADRIASYHALIQEFQGQGRGKVGEADYRVVMGPVVVENAKLELAAGRFERAETLLLRVSSDALEYAQARYLLGETARQRSHGKDGSRIDRFYREAIQADPNFPDAHRALGRSLLRQGQTEMARVEFRTYLRLHPQAPDRKYIEQELYEGR